MDDKKNAWRRGQAKNSSNDENKLQGLPTQVPRPPRLDTIKAAIDTAEFYRGELPHVKDWTTKADGWLRTNFVCVFHDEKTGSAGVNLKTGAYKCQGCGIYCGDVIDFQKERYKMDLPQARAALADRYGIQSSETPGNPPASPRKPRPAKPKQAPGPLAPIPAEALATRPKAHPTLGEPSRIWPYLDAGGAVMAYVYRFEIRCKDGNPDKTFRPLAYWPTRPSGKRGTTAEGWDWLNLPDPRPLYRLNALAARPEAPALICEGEKAADGAAGLLPDCVTLTTMNGAQAPAKSDFSPLSGRRVLIWPDADDPGATYAAKVANLALAAGAVSVEVLDLASLARDAKTDAPRDLLKGWDAADALADGWTPEALAASARWVPYTPAPGAKVATSPSTLEPVRDDLPAWYTLTPNGIVYAYNPDDAGRQTKPPLWVCPPMRVLATTRDEDGNDFGRLIEFKDLDGRTRQEVIADRERQGSGDALRARLAGLGFEVGTQPEARRLFLDLLRKWVSTGRARAVTRTGWTASGRAFVLPDRVIGDDAEAVVLAATGDNPGFGTQGTLAEWREHVACLCEGNSRLVFCVSLAFAPPLLRLVGGESGGFHLRGASLNASSSGKTTCQRVASSVCGPPAYLQRWRTTDNALEGSAELRNDALLVLDELNQIDARAAGEAAYMLANGEGKARMDRSAGARPVKKWRLLFLSSGEVSLDAHMATIQKRAKAGQEVRMAEIPAEAGAGLGVFEALHGHPDGAAFAGALSRAAATYYGTAFVAFVEALVHAGPDLARTVMGLQDAFVGSVLGGIKSPSGQVRRVAARFGLVAVAGEMATNEGITGWAPGAANAAAARCFADWLEAREGAGSAEHRDLLRQVRLFFEQHGNRFRWKNRAMDDHAPEVPKACGFKEEGEGGGIVY